MRTPHRRKGLPSLPGSGVRLRRFAEGSAVKTMVKTIKEERGFAVAACILCVAERPALVGAAARR